MKVLFLDGPIKGETHDVFGDRYFVPVHEPRLTPANPDKCMAPELMKVVEYQIDQYFLDGHSYLLGYSGNKPNRNEVVDAISAWQKPG